MNQNEYTEKRLDPQIRWYDKKAQSNKHCYKGLRILEIIIAAFIPFLTGYMTGPALLKFTIGSLGLLIVIITGIVSLCKLQENWIEFRTTYESLTHEKYLFETKTEPYNTEDPFLLLVQRVETLISKENTNWARYVTAKKEKNNG